MSRILLTGGAGFIGSCLARRLKSSHELHLILRPETNLWRISDFVPGVYIYRGDIKDRRFVSDVVNSTKPEIVCHLATYGVRFSQKDPAEIIATNIIGFINLANEAMNLGVYLFINTGSSSEYGIKVFPMKESDNLEPISIYGLSKASASFLSDKLFKVAGFPIVNLRLFTPYGPYDDPNCLVPNLLSCCLKGRDPDLASPDTSRDFIYIDDVVDAYEKIISGCNLNVTGETFNIGSGVQTDLKSLVSAAISATGAAITPNWNAYPRRPWDVSTWVADISKARNFLNWHPRSSLEEGLLKTIEWMRQSPDN